MSEKIWEDQCKFLRAELAKQAGVIRGLNAAHDRITQERQQLDEAHKEASHRLFHSEAELAQCRGELDRLQWCAKTADNEKRDRLAAEAERDTLKQSHAKLLEDYENANAEADTLKGENERLKLEVVGWEHSGATAEVMNKTLCQSVKSHRLLLDELGKWLDYIWRNSRQQEWSRETTDDVKATLTKYQQQCGEKGKV